MPRRVLLLTLTVSLTVALSLAAYVPASSAPRRASPLDKLNPALLSQGARRWLTGPPERPGVRARSVPRFGSNLDVNDPARDLAGGQSETAIAAGGRRVLAAWNDVTGLLVQPTTGRRGSLTGVGLSADNGRSFTDLTGLPNNNSNQQWFGDPTIVAVDDGRAFIIGSLYFPNSNPAGIDCARPARFDLAVSVARVAAGGRGTFTNPIVAVRGGNYCDLALPTPSADLALLDKEWLSYDPASRTLAMSYTRFFMSGTHTGTGQIELVRARVPANPAALTSTAFSPPVVIRSEEPTVVNTGAYVAVAPGGTAYVAWERNFGTNLPGGNGDPYVYVHAAAVGPGEVVPVADHAAPPRIVTTVVTKGQKGASRSGGVRSLDAIVIAGYNRGGGQDFPRVAVNRRSGAVIVVWNDASRHPLGDIFLRAFSPNLRRPGRIQKLNDDNSFALHFMPAVSIRADGAIVSSWYDRRLGGANSASTDYFGEVRRTPGGRGPDFRITTGPTDWTADSSLLTPNFGDYTDNASSGNRTWFTWSDGRLGVTQPFVDAH